MAILVAVSDLHVGSKLALCPPVVNLDEGGTYRANKAQSWLWPKWLEFWTIARDLRKKQELYLIIDGEFRDGIRFATQAFTTNEADIFRIINQVLEPVKELKPNYTFVFRGTEAHSGKASWFDELMADGLKDELNVQADNEGRLATWERSIEIEGVLFDITHHVSMGRLPHTEAPSVVRAAKYLEYNYQPKEKIPDIAIRAHQHRMYDTGDMSNIRMITLPSWKFPDAYILKFSQSKIPHFGGLIMEIDKGEIKQVVKYKESPRRAAAWRKK